MANAEIDVGQLSESQQLALEQYTAVTNQDIDAAVPLLQRSQWNVQIAIAKFFDGEQVDPVTEALTTQNLHSTHSTRQENLQENLRQDSLSRVRNLDPAPRINHQPDDRIVSRPPFVIALLLSPLHLIYKILSSSLGLFAYLFPFLPNLLRPRPSSRPSRMNTSGRRPLNPPDTAARFKREFEEEYGQHSLPLFDGGYNQALDLARKDLKFLLVVLISPEHENTQAFTRDTLLSPDVTSFISDPANNILLWGGNVQDSEAYQASTQLRCTKFPFSALIAHTPRQGPNSMSTVARLAGYVPPTTYISKLQSTIASYSEQLEEVRISRAAQQSERNIRQAQDTAYERSLAKDRENTKRRKEAEAARVAAQKKAEEEVAAAEHYAQNLRQWKLWRAATITPEPDGDNKDTVRIGLCFPKSAERITRGFHADSSIEELYAFAECYEVLKRNEVLEIVGEPIDFKHEYGFRLVSPVPRVVYSLEEGGSIRERVGKSANLIVEEDD